MGLCAKRSGIEGLLREHIGKTRGRSGEPSVTLLAKNKRFRKNCRRRNFYARAPARLLLTRLFDALTTTPTGDVGGSGRVDVRRSPGHASQFLSTLEVHGGPPKPVPRDATSRDGGGVALKSPHTLKTTHPPAEAPRVVRAAAAARIRSGMKHRRHPQPVEGFLVRRFSARLAQSDAIRANRPLDVFARAS